MSHLVICLVLRWHHKPNSYPVGLKMQQSKPEVGTWSYGFYGLLTFVRPFLFYYFIQASVLFEKITL
ncbi:hypothetical protein CIPAW_14G048600 [Carya illinoinensis]|uniref:Uncharacterized protein n=1 Tax=Carya illinoinensis TaxID=32201 RepID=A0A8T1NEZ5_CARIL|nr:hypothetical protein CIPAW_14G048600 [Carya illinoinensis]